MLLDECFCSYHSLRQQQNLSKKLQQLNVNVQCQHRDFQHQENANLQNGGKKRNFSSIKENDTMKNNFSQYGNNEEQKTKVNKNFKIIFFVEMIFFLAKNLIFYNCLQ